MLNVETHKLIDTPHSLTMYVIVSYDTAHICSSYKIFFIKLEFVFKKVYMTDML